MILAQQQGRVSSVSIVEAGLVLSTEENDDLMRLLDELQIVVQPFDAAMASAAARAARLYGKGRSSSKAKLNFGDCCVYATAQTLRLPLLYKGDDFTHTDVRRVSEDQSSL